MKTPRVNDFDPKATPTLRSPLDDMPAIERPKTTIKQPTTTSGTPQERSETNKVMVDSPPPLPGVSQADERQSEAVTPGSSQNVLSNPSLAHAPVRPYGSTSVRTDERTSVRRTITRYAFEFYRDQIETLKEFSLDEKLRGEKGSMSQMIREAVDMYIAKRRNRDEV